MFCFYNHLSSSESGYEMSEHSDCIARQPPFLVYMQLLTIFYFTAYGRMICYGNTHPYGDSDWLVNVNFYVPFSFVFFYLLVY